MTQAVRWVLYFCIDRHFRAKAVSLHKTNVNKLFNYVISYQATICTIKPIVKVHDAIPRSKLVLLRFQSGRTQDNSLLHGNNSQIPEMLWRTLDNAHVHKVSVKVGMCSEDSFARAVI